MRWGIISTGHIAGKFADALRPSGSEQVVAVASRDAARAAEFARGHGGARAYGSYAALLADADVDAVYIGLPNSMHAEWAAKAAAAGKHVLCEKPMGVSRAEAAAMFEAARAGGVWLMEAFMYRFHPRTLKLAELLRQGAIGEVRLVRASFAFMATNPADVRLNAELAGGALMDVGCYCVNLARLAVGQAPSRALAAARWAPSGVDLTLAGTLEYPGAALAQISCSLATSFHQSVQIVGSAGVIQYDGAFNLPADQAGVLHIRRDAPGAAPETIEFPGVNQYQAEAEGFARLVAAGHGAAGLPEMPLAETLDNMAAIEALLRSARDGGAVEVAQ
ncbi:Gfo/Idh/MocA family protein [Kouleothrix sp.]|uniref:Gfo/Idh/MocA family protein n=1 Tax=Kouleothrix sp. TaxID=2779161 RepID=UPI0039192FE5